jgi:hypothetical protein
MNSSGVRMVELAGPCISLRSAEVRQCWAQGSQVPTDLVLDAGILTRL